MMLKCNKFILRKDEFKLENWRKNLAVGDILVGLDIGFSELNLVVTRVNDFNQLDILFSSSRPCKNLNKDFRINKENVKKELATILKEVENKYNLKICSCYVSALGIYIDIDSKENLVTVKDPLKGVTEETILKAIEDVKQTSSKAFYTDIDIIPYKYILDNGKYVIDAIGKYSSSIVMLSQLIYLKNEYMDDVFDIFEELDLMVDGFVPVGLGQKEIFTNEKNKNSIMILDFNKKDIEINVFVNNAFVYADTLKFGTDMIAKVVSHNIDISEDEAKKLIDQYSLALRSYIENDNNILLKTTKNSDYTKSTIKTSYLIGIIEETLSKIFEKINKDLIKSGYKKVIDKIILSGDITNISQSDVLATTIFNTKVRKEYKERYIAADEKFFRSYSILKYIAKDRDLKFEYSSLVEQKEKTNLLKKILESIKDFFYS